jgi:hypothetical protein
MSSVTRFLRQIPAGGSLFNVDSATPLYVFTAGSGNYVGNYPPGTMNYLGPASSVNSYFGTPVFRDMGKTIQAAYAGNGTSSVGFFRCVQLLNPVAVASATAATNFGVNGSQPGTIASGNAGDDGYNTFYIPISVGGVAPGGGATPVANIGPIAGNIL